MALLKVCTICQREKIIDTHCSQQGLVCFDCFDLDIKSFNLSTITASPSTPSQPPIPAKAEVIYIWSGKKLNPKIENIAPVKEDITVNARKSEIVLDFPFL